MAKRRISKSWGRSTNAIHHRRIGKHFTRVKKSRHVPEKPIHVKKKFVNAMTRLRRMPIQQQRAAVSGASNEFIRDVSGFMKKIRNRPTLVKARQRKVLRKHGLKLRRLIHAKTPIHKKRQLLMQKGGIIPALIPIIVALIGAGGGLASAATSAAIIKS